MIDASVASVSSRYALQRGTVWCEDHRFTARVEFNCAAVISVHAMKFEVGRHTLYTLILLEIRRYA